MSFTNNLKNNVLNHVFRNTPYTSPSSVYVGLFSGASEISGNGYSRKEVTFGAPNNGVIKNNDEISFPIAQADWGEVTSASIYDSQSGGSKLVDAEIASVRVVRENDQFLIPSGNLTVEVE